MSTIIGTVQKPAKDSTLGITFSKSAEKDAPLKIRAIASDGAFATTDLVPGLIICKVNGVPVDAAGMQQAAKVAALLTDAGAGTTVSVEAYGILATAEKATQNTRVGISFQSRAAATTATTTTTVGAKNNNANANAVPAIYVFKVAPDGLFGSDNTTGSKLQRGQKVVAINGRPCPENLIEAIQMVKDAVGKLSIVVTVGDAAAAAAAQVELGSSEGISTTSTNSTNTTPVLVATSKSNVVVVSVNKLTKDTKVGIVLTGNNKDNQQHPPRGVMIKKIAPDGLLAGSGLAPGQRILKINGQPFSPRTTNKNNNKEAIALIREIQGTLTMEVESSPADQDHTSMTAPKTKELVPVVIDVVDPADTVVVASVQKPTKETKVGIVLTTTTDDKSMSRNAVVIVKIAPNGLFAGSSLQPGQRILKINGLPCPNTHEEAVQMIRLTPQGKLTMEATTSLQNMNTRTSGALAMRTSPGVSAHESIVVVDTEDPRGSWVGEFTMSMVVSKEGLARPVV